MGQVYRATDTKLGRDVALKVLPTEMAGDPERLARFQREARAVAALNHPHIVTIFSVEEAEGIHFFTMELVEGQTLDKLIPEGGLPFERIIEIAGALADALAAAHEKGIMHRDLKPANVMVTNDGRVKVLDFGLAKETRAEVNENTLSLAGRTQAGVVMGTPAYMSPEQVVGRALDHRTDIFSLGVMLHEMATGQRPFVGHSSAELTSAILRDTPQPVTDLRAELPADLARIIRRCLEKEPRHRVQTARDVANEFRDLAQQRAPKPLPVAPAGVRGVAAAGSSAVPGSGAARAEEGFWVAVLPFTHTGADHELESFAEGLAGDIIAGLAKFPYLSVISRNSTLRFKGQAADVRAVGQQLGARYVLEGGIRKSASTLRINMELIDTQSGAHLWAETYNRELRDADIFAVQDDITDRVVATVADSYGALVRAMAASVAEKPEGEMTASDWVLRHYRYRQFITPGEHAPVRDGLERFVEREPKHAAVWAALAQMYVHEFCLGYNQRPQPLERALEAARRAVHLDLTNQHGRTMLAFVHFFRKDIPAFRTTAEQAMEMNPRDTDTLGVVGLLHMYSGNFERGAKLVRRAMDLNPHHADWMHFALMWEHFQKGDYEAALAQVTRMSMPGLYWQPLSVAACCGLLGRKAEAAVAVQELLKLDKDFEQHTHERIDCWLQLSGFEERYLEGLRMAGLRIPELGEAPPAADAAEATAASSVSRGVRLDSGPAAASAEALWIAVLPFKIAAPDSEFESLGSALTEDVTAGLSRFPYLQVVAHNSAMAYKGRSGDIRAVGRELGARYVLEGSIRKGGRALRINVQLVDASSGAQLWAETYNRELGDAGPFEILDDLTDRIVATVADGYGVLVRSMASAIREKPLEQATASELVLRWFAYLHQLKADEHSQLRAGLERALEREPSHANAWACLANLYVHEYVHRLNPLDNSMERAREAAWRAVNIDPACQLGWQHLAETHFFGKDYGAFQQAAERAMSLNSRNTHTWADMAMMIAYSGDWERGAALLKRTMALNPHHPGWYHFLAFHDHYRKGEYEQALQAAKKINMPQLHWSSLVVAAASGQLNRQEEARTAIETLRKHNPTFLDLKYYREYAEKWFADKQIVEQLLKGLRKAGLKESTDGSEPVPALEFPHPPAKDSSGAMRAREGFWVAVLPFKCRGTEPGLEALAEGITEEIITGLSRFSYLRVIARGSTAKYSRESPDIPAIGKELGARYVMEGSIRQAGATARVAVQLVDAANGTHLWAESFERAFRPEAIFALQDELVPRIVSTVADQHGILPRSILAAIRKKGDEQVSPYEAIFRVFGMHERMTAPEHAAVRELLERAVKEAPNEGDCWAMLATLYSDEDWFGFNPRPDPLGRAAAAATRAVELAPASALASQALAQSLFMRREWQAFRPVAERTIALNPMDGAIVAIMGILLACTGEWERGCAVADSAMKLHPNFPGWYWLARVFDAYRTRDYRAAVDAALRIQMPEYFWTYIALAAAYGQLGEMKAAQKALRELLSIRPDFATAAHQELEKWFELDLVEHFLEGLRKAGLEIAASQKAAPTDTAPAAPSIAVLPFANLSADPEQDYFSDGLAEEILNLLAQISGLKVIARTSAFAFRGKEQDIRGIAEALGVSTILEGSVRRAGSRIRVTAQLIGAADGSHLWSERYDRELSDIFAVQDEISAAIAKALRVKLSREAAPQRYTPKLPAYEAYLKARYHEAKITPEAMELARQCYEQAGELDPAFAMPHVGLGSYWFGLTHFGRHPVHECVPAARAEIQRALQIDPTLPEAHALLGHIAATCDSDRAAAEKHFDFPRAKEVSLWLIRPLYGWYLFLRGDVQQAIELAERAIEEDPLEVWAHMNLHAYLQGAGRDDEALEQLQKVIGLDPNQIVALVSMAMIYADKGDLAKALEIGRRAYAVGPWYPDAIGVLAGLTRRNGEEVEPSLAKALGSGEAVGDARAHALYHLLCGEIDQGADWAEKALEQRDSSMMLYLRFVVSKGLRASQRWPKIAQMLDLPAEGQAKSSKT